MNLPTYPSSLRRGFTLIELLVVIAIIAILVALLLPAVQSVREAARRSQCQDHLHNLGLGLHNYEGTFKIFPPGWVGATGGQHDVEGDSGFAWGALLLPMIEQKPLYDQLNFEQSILSGTNAPFLRTKIDVFACPSDSHPDNWEIIEEGGTTVLAQLGSANYIGVFGSGGGQPGGIDLHDCEGLALGVQCRSNGLLFHNSGVRMSGIVDGTSSTIVIGERTTIPNAATTDHHSTWSGAIPEGEEAFARILGVCDHNPNSNGSGGVPHLDDFSSRHPGGAHFALGDGHVTFISENINHALYQQLSTIAGGESVQVP
ncbi:MAG: DUF1559 domain-containing protein [Planctomycetaceae bacterium]